MNVQRHNSTSDWTDITSTTNVHIRALIYVQPVQT